MDRMMRTRGSCVGAKRGSQSTRNNTEESQVSKRRERSIGEDTRVSENREENTMVRTRGSCVGAKRGSQSTRNGTEETQVSKRWERSTGEDTRVSENREENARNNQQENNDSLNETNDFSDYGVSGEDLHFDGHSTDEEDDSERSTRGPNRSSSFWKDPSERDEIHIIGTSFEEPSVPRTITSIIKGHIFGTWPTCGSVPPEIKDQWFETKFKGIYNWSQHNDNEVRRVWNAISENRYKQTFSRARDKAIKKSKSNNPRKWKNYKPSWITDVHWRGCIKFWCKEDWQKMSETNSKNRASEEHGGRPPKHRGGSVSFAVHQARWRKEHDGNDPTPYEFFDNLHKVEDGIYIDQKAQKTHEKYITAMEERYGPDVENYPNFDLGAWNEATNGPKKGCMYGLGSSELASQVINASRPSKGKERSQEDVDAMRRRIEELERENAEAKERAREIEELRREDNEKMEKVQNDVADLRAMMLGAGGFSNLLQSFQG